MAESRCELELPGFRFHPTDEELLNFYLKSMVFGKKFCSSVIGFLNIYNHDPRELPGLAKIGEREWYFFVPRDRKNGTGGRPNRTTEHGFWKATGSDRRILSVPDPKKLLGLKKTLVFYEGRAPRGRKTDWIMNEYRLPDKCSPSNNDIVLCKIYRKATSLKALEHKAAMEQEMKTVGSCSSSSPVTPPLDSMDANVSSSSNMGFKKENESFFEGIEESTKPRGCSGIVLPNGKLNFDLQVPSMDWTQDSFWTLFSPCLDNFAPFLPMC